LPEGASVRVETLLTAADDALVAAIEKLAKPRPHLPADYALNHGHYVGGEPGTSISSRPDSPPF